jgi:phosphatidylglycerophosphatase A
MTTSPESGAQRTRPTWRHLAEPVHLLALGFGAGLAPFAPGTFGSLVGLAFALVAVVLLAGIWICGESARRLGVHDHPAIVWDEVAGMMITMLAVPDAWWGAPLAFVLFRIFDIAKPWPIREIDHGLGGGTGIMLDDVLAGLFAALGLTFVGYVT